MLLSGLNLPLAAQVNVYEGFDYAPGTTLAPTTQGGFGWSGGWYGNIELSSTSGSRGTIAAGSYDVPAGLVATGNHVERSAFSSDGARRLEDSINTEAAGVIYFSIAGYFTSGAMSFGLYGNDTRVGPPVVSMNITSGNATMRLYNAQLGAEDGGVTRTIATGVSNTAFFWVGKLVMSPGNDRLDTWFYTDADAVPVFEPAGLLNVAGSNVNIYDVNVPIDRVRYLISNAGNGYDEIRIGETWDSVTTGPQAAAIPEPSTYAAMAGVVALGLATWRRRSQKAQRASSRINQ